MRPATASRVCVVVFVAAVSCGPWLAHPTGRAAEPGAESLTIGVVRQDGLLVPVAHFTGAEWAAAWDAPAEASEAARLLDRLRGEWPLPNRLGGTRWWVWPRLGWAVPEENRIAFDLARPVVAASHCQHLVAIATSGDIEPLRRPAVPDRFPLEMLGLAASRGDAHVMPARPFALQSDLPLRTLAQRTFRHAEDDLVAARPANEPFALPALPARLPTPVHWTNAYALRDITGARFVLGEGRAIYSDGVMTEGQVWMRMTAGQWSAVGDVAPGGDESKRGVSRVPLGTVHLSDRTFIVAMAYVYGGEHVEILEWPPDAARPHVVFQQPAGGC